AEVGNVERARNQEGVGLADVERQLGERDQRPVEPGDETEDEKQQADDGDGRELSRALYRSHVWRTPLSLSVLAGRRPASTPCRGAAPSGNNVVTDSSAKPPARGFPRRAPAPAGFWRMRRRNIQARPEP